MRKLLVVLALLGFASPAFSQTADTGTIKLIRTGWWDDAFAVVLNTTPVKNPKGCATADGYESQASAPGHHTFYQAVLAAYSANRKITVTISNTGCTTSNRPQIIGINLP
jgi:hypothetical protein